MPDILNILYKLLWKIFYFILKHVLAFLYGNDMFLTINNKELSFFCKFRILKFLYEHMNLSPDTVYNFCKIFKKLLSDFIFEIGLLVNTLFIYIIGGFIFYALWKIRPIAYGVNNLHPLHIQIIIEKSNNFLVINKNINLYVETLHNCHDNIANNIGYSYFDIPNYDSYSLTRGLKALKILFKEENFYDQTSGTKALTYLCNKGDPNQVIDVGTKLIIFACNQSSRPVFEAIFGQNWDQETFLYILLNESSTLPLFSINLFSETEFLKAFKNISTLRSRNFSNYNNF